MLQKKLILILNKKVDFLKNFFNPLLIIVVGILFTFYSGYRGVFPIDSFLIYDAGYKIINGFHPFKDYWTITGPFLDYLQFLFFKFLGINWFSYVLHASIINLFLSLFLYFFLLKLEVKKSYCLIYALSISILAYPSAGTPFMDHHAAIFSLISLIFFLLALKKNNKLYWFLVPIFLSFSFLSKQIPSVYLASLIAIVIPIFFYLNKSKNFKNFFFIFIGGILSFLIFFLIMIVFKIPFENFWVQYILYPMEIGSTRYGLIGFDFKKLVSQFKFIYFSLIPLFFITLKIFISGGLNVDKKKDILQIFFVIISVAIFIYCQILTRNQILIFFLIPFILGFTHYLSVKYKVGILVNIILITILFISSVKFNERFNIDRKFMELNKVDFTLSKNAIVLDKSLKNLKWITPHYPNNPGYELSKLIELKEILLKDKNNKIILTNYQILPSLIELKNISPNKWFDVQSVPNINSKYFQLYKNFFIQNIKSQDITIIYYMGLKIKYLKNILDNNCYEISPVNEIASKIDISKCFNNF